MQTEQFKLHADIEERHWWFVARRRIMRAIANQVLPPSPATTVLDVGCGTGGNIAALANDYRCLGIDTSAEAIALATVRFPRVKFVCGTAPDDVREQLRDVRLILLMDVLEHVADDVTLLSNLVSAAPKGTYFLITVPANPRLSTPTTWRSAIIAVTLPPVLKNCGRSCRFRLCLFRTSIRGFIRW